MTSHHLRHTLVVISRSQVQPTLDGKGLYKGTDAWGHLRVYLPQTEMPKGAPIGRPEILEP